MKIANLVEKSFSLKQKSEQLLESAKSCRNGYKTRRRKGFEVDRNPAFSFGGIKQKTLRVFKDP